VIISTYPHTIDLAEQVHIECLKAGADPFMVLDTDKAYYAQFKHLSEENLKRVSAHCVGLAEYTRSYVWLGGPRDPGLMARVPREKFAAMFDGEEAHHIKNLEKNPKNVVVPLGSITRERAKVYGFNFAKWKQSVEDAIAVNYAKLQASGARVADLLGRPADVRVTADNGTDLRFKLAGESRKRDIDDGVISDEDIANENTDASLPAGTVWVAPIEGSAQGTFICDVGIPQVGRVIEGMAWTFKDGTAVEFTAKRNLAAAQTNWAGASGDRDRFSSFALGLNPRLKPGFLQSVPVAGAVTVAIGDNRDLGGKNVSTYGFPGTLVSGTVEMDGKVVIDRGKWVA
jgi:leucyl aminopeptidase (aminopeptidase T)